MHSDTPKYGLFQLGGYALCGGMVPSGTDWLPAIAST